MLPIAILQGEGPGVPAPDLTRYVLISLVLVGGICALGLLVRRLAGRGLRLRAHKRSLQVLDVLPLGGRQKLMVVRCYDRSFLLGVGEKELRSIAELDPAEESAPEPAAPAAEPARSAPRPFAASLHEEIRPPSRPRRPVLENGEGILG